jgi:ribosome maturation protein SDO1
MSEKYTIARLTKGNEHFEILVKPDKALDYRIGKTSGITEVLAAEIIFSDANKGTRVSEEQMNKSFETIDPLKIADEILKKGTLQLTTEQRRKMTEDKRRQVIDFISRQAVDPILPLKIEQISVAVLIPAAYSARAYGVVKNFGDIKQDEWRPNGSWQGIIEMPVGAYASFINKLGDITKGNGEAKILS